MGQNFHTHTHTPRPPLLHTLTGSPVFALHARPPRALLIAVRLPGKSADDAPRPPAKRRNILRDSGVCNDHALVGIVKCATTPLPPGDAMATRGDWGLETPVVTIRRGSSPTHTLSHTPFREWSAPAFAAFLGLSPLSGSSKFGTQIPRTLVVQRE